MKIDVSHSYLVHPARNVETQPDISGTLVHKKEKLFGMLSDLFARAPNECDIEVVFVPEGDGMTNKCQSHLAEYARAPSLTNGRLVAECLQRVTTHRSGLGLLFLMAGTDGARHHVLVLSRFPADQGVVAQESKGSLSVEFIERVFMRNAKSYKSAIYRTTSKAVGFAEGRAVDRQLTGPKDLSDYWIKDFLQSDLRTTGPAGTRRLAEAMRAAIRNSSSVDAKQQLISAAHLMQAQGGQARSARSIVQRLGLSDEAVAGVVNAFPRPELINERFRFDADEFKRHLLYRSVELHTGAVLTAEDSKFDDLFRRELMVAEPTVRYTTEGRIVDQRLRKSK